MSAQLRTYLKKGYMVYNNKGRYCQICEKGWDFIVWERRPRTNAYSEPVSFLTSRVPCGRCFPMEYSLAVDTISGPIRKSCEQEYYVDCYWRRSRR